MGSDRCPWPLTFTNAPTVERDGKRYVRDDVFEELARRIVAENATLLARLAEYD